jgi:ribose/xylose/arabinose/galactoside ABC-type transport system permease subunit
MTIYQYPARSSDNISRRGVFLVRLVALTLLLAWGLAAAALAQPSRARLSSDLQAYIASGQGAAFRQVGGTKIAVFTLNGLCAALGGIFLAAKIRACAPTIGEPFTLLIVASCVLGGASLTGGKGSALGTVLGVFTVAIINNGMNFIGVDAYWQNVVFGVFVLAAIAVSVDRSTRGLMIK